VLSETDLLWIAAKFHKEELGLREKVPKTFIIDDALFNSLANRQLCNVGFTRELHIPIKQIELHIGHFVESRMLLSACDR